MNKVIKEISKFVGWWLVGIIVLATLAAAYAFLNSASVGTLAVVSLGSTVAYMICTKN